MEQIGLSRGTVHLVPHQTEWEGEAQRTIYKLKQLLGEIALDIQHVGSTSIPTIAAKPIIDIVVAVRDFESVLAKEDKLKNAGFYYRPNAKDIGNQILFACGSYYEGTGDLQTHFIHVVFADSMEYRNYLLFRDYLRAFPKRAKEYEALKFSLAQETPVNQEREKYTNGKKELIVKILRKALAWSYLGKTVNIYMDRPLGTYHPKYPEMLYPVNYGYIPGVFSADGEELDVYLLGVLEPVKSYTAQVIAVVHRLDDIEDKLVAAPENRQFTKEEIESAIHFQEQYFKIEVEMLSKQKTC